MTNEEKIAVCAEAAHEQNRTYCRAIGDLSQPHWEDAPQWQRESAIKGVTGAISGYTPKQSHDSWLEEKRRTGWKYGPVKNPETKEHPCFVEYSALPPDQRLKDQVYIETVKTMAHALGLI